MGSFDPLASWYAHHYGRGRAAAAQAAADAQVAADMAQGVAVAAAAVEEHVGDAGAEREVRQRPV